MQRVVLVEDDAANVTAIKTLLQDFYHLKIFFNAEDALKYIKKNAEKVDIVLTDNELPRMNGWNLAYEIKRRPKLGHLPVVMQSGKQSKYLKYTKYIDKFLEKPYKRDDLMSVLDSACKMPIKRIRLTMWRSLVQKIGDYFNLL